MEKKPGWTYVYSESLKQTLALHNKSGWLYCEDGVKYSPRELAILHQIYGDKPIPWQIHTTKKVFGGEIQETGVVTQAENQTAKPPVSPSPASAKENDFDIF